MPKDLRSAETKAYHKQAREDAQDWANTWSALARQRYDAASRGESSPWLGLKQWATEIPLNWNMRIVGGDDKVNDLREQRFQAEMERLQRLNEQKVPREKMNIQSPWTGL